MASVTVGLFSLTMAVQDQTSRVISRVDSTTVGPHHVVNVQNITTLPRRAKICASLAYGMARLEFEVDVATGAAAAGGAAGTGRSKTWWGETPVIPGDAQRRVECRIVRNGGRATNTEEPLMCDEVYDQRGTLGWRKLSCNEIPWQISVIPS